MKHEYRPEKQEDTEMSAKKDSEKSRILNIEEQRRMVAMYKALTTVPALLSYCIQLDQI